MITIIESIQQKINKNRKRFISFYIAIAFMCCYITLKLLANQISESIRILCYFLCVFSIIKLDVVTYGIKHIFNRPWKKALQIVLEIYGTFAITGMYFLPANIEYERQYPFFVYFILSFCWICPIMKALMFLLFKEWDILFSGKHEVTIKTRLSLIMLTLLPCIVFLVAFNPAITSTDSEVIFPMAYNLWQPGANLIDWHPPFYAFVLNLLLKVCPSISFLIMVQCLYFALVFSDAILFLYQVGFSKKILAFFYIFIAFGVSNVVQLVTLWKDIPYMISIMWLTLLLMKLIIQYDKYDRKKSWYVQFAIAIIFTSFFRQNGILPAMVLIILLPIIMKGAKEYILTSLICLLLMAVIKGPLYDAMNVTPQPQLKFFALANDIMYSYYYGKSDVPDEAMEMINRITNNSPDDFEYNPYWVGYNKDEPSGYSIGEFINIYLKSFSRNPGSILTAIATRNSAIWSIARPIDEPIRNVNFLGEKHTYAPRPYSFRINNIFTYIFTNFSNWLSSNSVYYIFCWRTGIYNLLIFSLVVITLCIQKEKRLRFLIPYIPILGNLFSLLVSSGWTDYRYYWPSMTIGLLLLFYFFYNTRRARELVVSNVEENQSIRIIPNMVVILCCVLGSLGCVLYQETNSYKESLIQNMREDKCLESYLNTLVAQKKNAIIEIKDLDIWKSSIFVETLRMSGFDINSITDETDCIILFKGKCIAALEGFHENESGYDTDIGRLCLNQDEYGKQSVFLNNKELYFQTLDMEETANIYIAVTNDDMTEVIDFVVADYLIESEGITEKSLTKIWHVDRDVYNNTGEG